MHETLLWERLNQNAATARNVFPHVAIRLSHRKLVRNTIAFQPPGSRPLRASNAVDDRQPLTLNKFQQELERVNYGFGSTQSRSLDRPIAEANPQTR